MSLDCRSQDGTITSFLADEPLTSDSQLAFRPPTEFGVGSCRVRGGVTASATWNFNVDGNVFNVGTAPLSIEDMTYSSNFPVGFAPNDSLLGAAVHNPNNTMAECTLRLFDKPQSPAFDLTQVSDFEEDSRSVFDFQVPPQGQIASFFGEPFNASAETLSFINALIHCSEEVLSILLTQNLRNGFPTPVEGSSVPE